ncbi:hypothetical protein [Stenotrophomonas hibiscicola]|uniref:hypothetical protein n=1 Tax=Stenotrophomonas hibiscicola TaxID=86189 RepID=UPI000361558D|nr:hypothetical protein [[Pseudomonas] hibiscicola]
MTTDNKTMAIDVLAVMDREAKLARHYRIENGAVKIAEEASADACAARAAVAELIEADDRLHDTIQKFGNRVPYEVVKSAIGCATALARVKGESA